MRTRATLRASQPAPLSGWCQQRLDCSSAHCTALHCNDRPWSSRAAAAGGGAVAVAVSASDEWQEEALLCQWASPRTCMDGSATGSPARGYPRPVERVAGAAARSESDSFGHVDTAGPLSAAKATPGHATMLWPCSGPGPRLHVHPTPPRVA